MRIQLTSISINELGQRTNQEDSIFPSVQDSPSNGPLFILCDGMGGHAAGEVASQTVCSSLSSFILSHPPENGVFEEKDFSKALEYAYAALDENDTNDVKKMGTTLAFAMFHKGGCFVAHIGDSRVYHIRPSSKSVLFVTRDHSLVNELVTLGELTPEEAKVSRQKNVITRVMQPHQEKIVMPDCTNLTDLKKGDYIYICSDGMLEQMDDREIVNILAMRKPDSEKMRILRGATKDNKDNHSAHLIRITSVDPDKEFYSETKEGKDKNKHRALWLALAVAVCALLAIVFYVLKMHI